MTSTSCYFAEFYYAMMEEQSLWLVSLEIAITTFFVTWLLLRGDNKPGRKKLTDAQRAALIERWIPEPLVGEVPANHSALHPKIVSGSVGKRIVVDGHDCLNLGSHNYLGLLEETEIQKDAIKTVRKYGVGSCGPRGFYGTIDVHLELEERIAKFMGMEEAVLYSYGFSTVASAISTYSKRKDVVFADECVNFAIQKGLDASRSRIVYFKHNDMDDLERLLDEQKRLDKKNPKKASKVRRFIVAEAIYLNTGEMCPLNELVALRAKYKLRLFLDEGLSFGTIGAHGRGLTEYLNVDRKEVDLICSSLEHSVGSIGGFSVGTAFIVENQRLSGLGYCFSASAPPLLVQAAISALDRFEKEPKMFQELNSRCEKVSEKFQKLTALKIRGHSLSPVKHLYIRSELEDREAECKALQAIADKCIERGLAVVYAQYLEEAEKNCPRPSIRIAVSRLLTGSDIKVAFAIIESVSKEILF